MLKWLSGIQPRNRLPKKVFYLIEVFIGLRQFCACIAKDVFHVWNLVLHVNGQCGGVLSTRKTQNVPRFLTHFVHSHPPMFAIKLLIKALALASPSFAASAVICTFKRRSVHGIETLSCSANMADSK